MRRFDLEHADMAYEWLYGGTDSRQGLPDEQKALSKELADQFPAYLASLNLSKKDGTKLTAENYLDYVKELLIAAPVNGGMPGGTGMRPMMQARAGEYITDLDMPHWFIRHGARDRDTAFPVPVNFATKLQNQGLDVDFLLAWNRPQSGDYALDELFDWIKSLL